MLTYDEGSNVLYVKVPDSTICRSAELVDDGFTIVNYDVDGEVVGLQILEPTDLTPQAWENQYHTGEIPEPIFQAVLSWLLDFWSNFRNPTV